VSSGDGKPFLLYSDTTVVTPAFHEEI